ncbi:DNA-binding protein [Streptomyces scopuliridis]|uniref:DNA-binding protein n=1 Tax=Streptomyces scopuliridis TaxID=452529 RepID=A0ACD4ZJF2_9ACTN|nr:DNA-binding protein [Streptomyces scopuliridis]WSB34032.1 DNA-binding protein [Streptomyces scopuliridis]WSB98314.1 DNA-binding protein [Streptomyces scopuliridis]WSC07984.1 DNA-binding protein [Streptomyces scopuliridis]
MGQGGTLVLDSEGLSKVTLNDRRVMGLVRGALEEDMRVVASILTLIEAHHPRVNQSRFDWALSRLVVEPVSEAIGRKAMALFKETGLHGHKYAIDAVVAATALRAPGPTVILTSDPEDLELLCGRGVRIVKV